MKRYLIENDGANPENTRFMLSEAMRICQRDGMSRITLFVPNKGSFPSTLVGQLLGSVATKLCKGESVRIEGNLLLDLQSANKISNDGHYEMIVGVYLSLEALFKLESALSAKAIIFLPWTEKEGKMWLSTWKAKVLGRNNWQVQQASLPPEVNDALSALTQGINLSTGLAHPSDRDAARKVLIKLKNLNHMLSPNDVKVWALQNGWRSDVAMDLAEEVGRIFKSNRI